MNPTAPKPKKARPAPPAHLSIKAKTVWGEVSAVVYNMGVLTVADGMALEGLCEAYADLRSARAALQERGALTYETVTTSGGVMFRAHPEVAMAADADRRFMNWLSKFGLTPADRSRVSGEAQKEPSVFDEMFGTG